MKQARLVDVAEVLMGTAPPGDSYNQNRIGYPLIAGAADFGDEYPKVKKFTSKPTTLSTLGDIILCVRATIGDLNWSDGIYCLGRGVAGIRVRDNVADRKYIFFCLIKQAEHLKRLGTGSTFRQIRRDNIENCHIPLPRLPVQKKIAAILEKADLARRKRREALRLTDQFLQSAFLEMFGDPVKNPKGWEVTSIGKVTDCLDNQRIPVTKSDRNPGPYPYYGASGIVDWVDKFIFNESLLLLAEDGENLRSRVKPVAFCIDGKAWVNNHAHVLRCTHIDRFFLTMILNWMDYSPRFAGATRPKITKSTMENLKIIYPPIDMQEQFSALVQGVETFSEKQEQSERELEALFQSLMQKAFRGELVT